jgi:cytidylate kinase
MVIFISGSINSGKTTVAKILKQKLPRTAHIEVDNLRAFIDWMPLEDSIPINLDNTILIINSFSSRNISSIVSYPLSKAEFEYMTTRIKSREKIYFFTLNPSLKTALSNRNGRELTEWEKERIKYHYSIGINDPDFGVVINNTMQSAEETVNEIISHLTISNY